MWKVITLCFVLSYTLGLQAQYAVEATKYPYENNTFLYEQQNGKFYYFTLDSLPAFNQSFDELSSFDENGYAWANAGSELFIINVIKKELIHFPNELRFMIKYLEVSFVSEISNKVYFPLDGGFYLNQKGELISPLTEIIDVKNKKALQNESQEYISDVDFNNLDDQHKEGIRIISKHLKFKGEWVFEPGLYSDIEFFNDFTMEIYYLVRQKRKWGVVSSTGDIIIPCNYAKIEMITKSNANGNQHFFMVKNTKKGLIAGDGSVIIPCIYDEILYEDIDEETDGLLDGGFVVIRKGKSGITLHDGTLMVPCKYKDVNALFSYYTRSHFESIPKVDKTKLDCDFYPFSFYGIGKNKDKTMDFYSPQGDFLNTLAVNELHGMSSGGYITFEKNEKIGLIGKSACLKIPPIKDEITIIQRTDELLILCNEKLENGDYKIELLDEDLKSYFSNKINIINVYYDQMLLCENGMYGLADLFRSSKEQLSWTLLPEYDEIQYFSINNWKVKKNGKTGIIDNDRNMILQIEFDSIYRDGYEYFVEKNGKMGVLNNARDVVLPVEFESVYRKEKEYLVKENGKYSFYDLKGTKISEEVFDSIGSRFTEEGYKKFYTVLISDKWSIFELDTKTTLNEFRFDEIEYYRSNYLKVINNGLQGLLSGDLKEILPIIYKTIDYDYKKRAYICVLPSGKKVMYDYDFKRKD